jgi:hypothetical protein
MCRPLSSGRASSPAAQYPATAESGESLRDLAAGLADVDAFGFDARLRKAIQAIRTAELRTGRHLRLVIDHHLYSGLGFRSVDAYVRERLGLSLRKVWALVKVEKMVRRVPELAVAYGDGTLSWVRALTLLPVIDRARPPALPGPRLQQSARAAGPPHHVPFARWQQCEIQSDSDLRGAPPPRHSRGRDPRVGLRPARAPLGARRPGGCAALAEFPGRPAVALRLGL